MSLSSEQLQIKTVMLRQLRRCWRCFRRCATGILKIEDSAKLLLDYFLEKISRLTFRWSNWYHLRNGCVLSVPGRTIEESFDCDLRPHLRRGELPISACGNFLSNLPLAASAQMLSRAAEMNLRRSGPRRAH